MRPIVPVPERDEFLCDQLMPFREALCGLRDQILGLRKALPTLRLELLPFVRDFLAS
jgi:hypothetical protein